MIWYLIAHFTLAGLLIWWGYRVLVKPTGVIHLPHLCGLIGTLFCPWAVGLAAGLTWLMDHGVKVVLYRRPEPTEKEKAYDAILTELGKR